MDIATRRRNIANLRAKNEVEQTSAYSNIDTGIQPISRAHTNQQHLSEICQNGFKGISDFNFPSENES